MRPTEDRDEIRSARAQQQAQQAEMEQIAAGADAAGKVGVNVMEGQGGPPG
jgi:pyridoxine 5'-phosphate synthase PdxJ